MNISKRMRRRASRKMTAALSALLLVGGAMLVTAPQAFAEDEPTSYYGTVDGKGTTDKESVVADGGKITFNSENASTLGTGDTITGSSAAGGDVKNGSVTIEGIKIEDEAKALGQIVGGIGYPSATGNSVIIKDSIIPLNGTYEEAIIGGSGAVVNDSKVVITNSTIKCNINPDVKGNIVGAQFYGEGDSGSAKNNSVTVIGGAIIGDIYAAKAMFGDVVTDNNAVNLVGEGGTLSGIEGSALIIKGTVYGAAVFGFDSEYQSVLDLARTAALKGNSINVYGKGITAGNIAGVQNLNFYLPSSMDASKDVILTLTADEATDLTKTKVAIDATNKTDLTGGNVITLIKKNAGTLSVADDLASTKQDVFIVQSAFKHKSGTISNSENNLILTVSDTDKEPYNGGGGSGSGGSGSGGSGEGAFGEGTTEQEQTNMKNVAETRASAAALVNEGADFVQTQAMPQARAAAGASQAAGNSEMAPFAAMGGSNMRYETGSYVNSKGWNGAVGVAKNLGKSTFGVAISYGKSNYDSHMDNGTEGSGSSSATGLTLFSEWKNDKGIYSDVALRFGRVKSDYKATLSNGGVPVYTAYENSSNYYGFSVGGGKEIALGENGDSVDIYGRYFYTHTNGSDTTTNTNDQLSFSGMDSNRIRIGSRYNHKMNDKNVFYTGLAWQYEFSGEAKTTVNGLGAPVPGLKGHSGMLEIGTKIQANNNLTVDLNLNGWVGKQRGISGGVGLNFTF